MQKQNKEIGKIIYDTENSIIFEDYLDLLLNKSEHFFEFQEKNEEDQNNNVEIIGKKWALATKFEQYEIIRHYNKNGVETEAGKPNKEHAFYTGGLKLPKPDKHAGSGNIVIIGNPGSGKSTLAFQIAAACVSEINNGIAVYYSLEFTPKDMLANMMYDGGGGIAKIWFYLPEESEHDEPRSKLLYEWFEKVLRGSNSENDEIKRQILFPVLSPRGLAGSKEPHRLFMDRYAELELMLKTISKYNEETKKYNEKNEGNKKEKIKPYIKVVVLDSLNAFGDAPLNREELFRLFELFHHYDILGVFTLENSESKAQNENQLTSDIVKFMSDVVILLDKEVYNNYTCQYIEIEKSHYISQVIGKHPYKVVVLARDEKINLLNLRKRIEIMPSLHYRIFASEAKSAILVDNNTAGKEIKITKDDQKTKNLFGIEELDIVLPNHFKNRSMNIPQIITIKGDSGLYKSDIAINALFNGILLEEPENGLIIRMNDRSVFSSNGVRLSTKIIDKLLLKDLITNSGNKETDEIENEIILYERDNSDRLSRSEHKYTSKMWSLNKNENKNSLLIEIAFKSGALLPEEFIEEVCHIIKRYTIKRVVFTDIKAIGVSYPFLINSKTSGNIFLSAFIHLMRNYGVHVIMSCSESGYKQSDDEMHKANILSDAVLSLGFEKRISDGNKTGEKNIVIEGEGLITNNKEISVGLTTNMDIHSGDIVINEKNKEKYYFKFIHLDKKNEEKVETRTNALCPFIIAERSLS